LVTRERYFKVPADRVSDFVSDFIGSLTDSELLEDVGGKKRVIDITHAATEAAGTTA